MGHVRGELIMVEIKMIMEIRSVWTLFSMSIYLALPILRAESLAVGFKTALVVAMTLILSNLTPVVPDYGVHIMEGRMAIMVRTALPIKLEMCI